MAAAWITPPSGKKFYATSTCRATSALHIWNQAFAFSMLPIFAATASASMPRIWIHGLRLDLGTKSPRLRAFGEYFSSLAVTVTNKSNSWRNHCSRSTILQCAPPFRRIELIRQQRMTLSVQSVVGEAHTAGLPNEKSSLTKELCRQYVSLRTVVWRIVTTRGPQ